MVVMALVIWSYNGRFSHLTFLQGCEPREGEATSFSFHTEPETLAQWLTPRRHPTMRAKSMNTCLTPSSNPGLTDPKSEVLHYECIGPNVVCWFEK